MLRITHTWITSLVLAFACCGPAIATGAPDLSHAWFLPTLAVNNDANCAAILAATREQFATSAEWDDESGPLSVPVKGFALSRAADGTIPVNPDIQPNSDDDSLVLTEKNGTRTRVLFNTNIGCGSACDTEDAIITAISSSGVESKEKATTPEAPRWTIYTSDAGAHYLVGLVDGHLEAYLVTAPASWRIACRISLVPENLVKLPDSDVQSTLQAVDALNTASLGMSRAGGENCGSMETPARWESDVQDALRQSLYRPWALGVRLWNPQSENSFGQYDRILPSLTQWSLGGLSENAAFQAYRERIAQTQKILATFYMRKFAWPQNQASAVAESALTNAIAHGYGFYMYQAPDNLALRAAILEHKPIADIRAIPFENPPANADSLLNIAVLYPEAISYLLEKGLNPNQANIFGKTPLMYAAQYNQPAAARLLLQHGADPNASTVAYQECGWSVRTASMTPLHYAARYSSAEMLKLLIENGAVAFIAAHNEDWSRKNRSEDETPLDWLLYYSSDQDERNAFLTPAELPALTELLKVPAPTEIERIARDQANRGDKALITGDFEAAYQALHVALVADPKSQRAISDLPLAAIKSGRLGEAAVAAKNALATLKSPAAQAAAWFNMGLVCEQAALNTDLDSLPYDGNFYCKWDYFAPFLQAWRSGPTAARINKLVQVLKTDPPKRNEPGICVVGDSVYRFTRDQPDGALSSEIERIYVLHPISDKIDPSSIQWTVRKAGGLSAKISPRPSAEYVLNGETLTILEAQASFDPITVAGQTCK